jgi:hypothetical protein
MSSWVRNELRTTQLGHKRRTDRLIQMVADLAEQPGASIPQACEDWWKTKAAYRFWDNKAVTSEGLLSGHREMTIRRSAECPVVLAVQDTTEINLSHHPATQGTGYLANPKSQGMLVHSLLAVSGEGTPLGLLDQKIWVRPAEQLGKRHQRKKKPVSEKESQRWLDGLAAAQAALPDHPQVVVVGDSEADIFELFAAPRRPGVDVLVRVSRNTRRVEHPQRYLEQAVRASRPWGTLNVELPRADGRPARSARLTVRCQSLEVRPPSDRPASAGLKPVRLQVVLVEEEHPPAGRKGVSWLLITTLVLPDFAAVIQGIGWYVLRWRIERFHYVLKSGCRIEERELETVARMQRALATFSIIAWRLLWLTYAARTNPDAPCDGILETHEWQSLYAIVHQTTEIPEEPPSLRDALRMIAKLGGFLSRPSDGEPGVKTLWRGLCRLHDISATWKFINTHYRLSALDTVLGNA